MDKFIEVMNAIGSMCRGRDCSTCPLDRMKNGWDVGCTTFMVYHPEEALIKVSKWVDDNSRPTWDEFFAQHGHDKIPDEILKLIQKKE